MFLEIYKCIFLGEVAGDFFFSYQEVIEHDLENLCKMDISPSTLDIWLYKKSFQNITAPNTFAPNNDSSNFKAHI